MGTDGDEPEESTMGTMKAQSAWLQRAMVVVEAKGSKTSVADKLDDILEKMQTAVGRGFDEANDLSRVLENFDKMRGADDRFNELRDDWDTDYRKEAVQNALKALSYDQKDILKLSTSLQKLLPVVLKHVDSMVALLQTVK
jgi:primase-polymerase (primpol)-like protein